MLIVQLLVNAVVQDLAHADADGTVQRWTCAVDVVQHNSCLHGSANSLAVPSQGP